MDISKFYELRTRLYNAAAAGCMTVSEDFRLKRAVEDFKPLAEANKAFAKLYSLCGELLSSDKPERVIPDCIALADALAVTQGIFADNSETTPAEGIFAPTEKPASALAAVEALIHKGSAELWKLPKEYKDTLRDPRVIFAFLNELETGRSNENFNVFCEIMCGICGKALVPALKATVKETGRQLQYIVKISGDEENEFFRELAQDENTPEKVRLAAISVLSCSQENGALLAELYNTGKAKVKQAALLAMAEMDAPEAEPIFEKLLENYEKNRKTLGEAIIASSGKACTEFVRKYLLELDRDTRGEGDKANKAANELESGAYLMLTNKSDLDDVYLALEDKSGKKRIGLWNSNEALTDGLTGKNKVAVRAQIDRLYAKAPDAFSEAKVYSDILNDPAMEPVVSNDQYDRKPILTMTKYIPLLGGYFKQCYVSCNESFLPLFSLSDKLPEWLIRYIYDSADNAEKLFKSLEAPTRDEMVEKAEKLGSGKVGNSDALMRIYPVLQRIVNPVADCLYSDYLVNCAPEDYEPLRQAAMYLARKCVPIVGDGYFDKMIAEYIPEITPKEHSKMIVDFTVNNMIRNNKPLSHFILSAISDPLTPDEKAAALTKLRARISEWRGKMNDNIIDSNLNLIDNYLKEK